jgi:hypothetical protein
MAPQSSWYVELRGYYHLVVAGGNSFPVELVALAFGFGGAGVCMGRGAVELVASLCQMRRAIKRAL